MKLNNIFYGVCESRDDPLYLGRCKVRIVGIHTDNKTLLPTEDLPWAYPMAPITSASMNGIGQSPIGPVEGTWVVILFNDDYMQQPVMIGTVGGIPMPNGAKAEDIAAYESGIQEQTTTTNVVTSDGTPVSTGSGGTLVTETSSTTELYLGQMTTAQYKVWKEGIGKKESGGNYGSVNTIGYAGKYQFGVAALEDLGYVQKGTWAKYKKNSALKEDVWTGKDNVTSLQGWLGAKDVQENVMDIYVKRSYRLLKNAGIFDDNIDAEKLGGLLAVAHNQGTGAVVKWIKKGQSGADAYGTTVEGYYKYGFKAVKGNTTSECPPKLEKMTDPASDLGAATIPDNTKYDPAKSTTKVVKKVITDAGFKDPNGYYPLEDKLQEPDTNRLARSQKLEQTIVGEKEADRDKSIAIANTTVTWAQPPIPYNAQYPYNHVYESEAGHIMEFDDTPDAERINIHHCAGTFLEIDTDGNRTDKVIGSKVVIVENDDLLYVKGGKHITIDADATIIVRGQCQIQVMGDASINVAGNMYSTVKGNANHDVTGDYKLSVGGEFHLQAGGNIAADGKQIHLNGGQSVKCDAAPVYTVSVVQPSPITRQEAQSMNLEGTEERETSNAPEQLEAPPPKVEKVDTTPTPEQKKPDTGACEFGDLTYTTQLTTNYTLGDLCKESGRPFPFKGSNNGLTDKEIACNLKQLCLNIVEPLKAKYASLDFKLNSGYRNGEGTSQHTKGQAVDISFGKIRGHGTYAEQCKKFFDIACEIRNSGLPYDQLIFETDPAKGWMWIHVSFNPKGNRPTSDTSKVLSYLGKKPYVKGLVLTA